MKNEGSLSFFSRMSTKIALLISAVVLAVVAVQVIIATNRASRQMESTYLNYAQNLAEEAASGVDFAADLGLEAYGGYAKNLAHEAAVSINFSRRFGETVYKSYAQNLAEELVKSLNIASSSGELSRATLDGILRDAAIKDVRGSYAYMVSPEGTMMWHPDSGKIGQPVENAAVKGILADIRAGYAVRNGSVLYEYRNALKLAGYAFTSGGNIVIVTADYDEFMKIDYNALLGNIHIDVAEGSYAYMVSPEGTMLWHPDSGKIGQPVENAAVKGLVADIKAGRSIQDGYVVYDYRGSRKLAGYSFTDTGNIVLVTADYDRLIVIDYGKLIGGIRMSGVPGSYAYMVSPEGTMLYHRDAQKIGQPVENAAVRGIVSELRAGRTVLNSSCTYDYKGSYKAAGYAFTKSGNIVIVTADYDAMMLPVGRMRKSLIAYGIACEVAAVVMVYLFTVLMLRALGQIVPVIRRTAGFDLSEDEASARLEGRSDEIGLISRALSVMRENLRDIVGSIAESCESIEHNVGELKQTIDRAGQMCEDNSAVTEQLAAGMEETASSTASISRSAGNVKEHALSIDTLAAEGAKLTGEVISRADALSTASEQAGKRTSEIFGRVKRKSDEAIESSQAVNRINDLIGDIMSISTQTAMLSLNASIEAARAGDKGRGFSVVASEIRGLAGQTSEVVQNISAVVEEVNGATARMSECLNEAVTFLEESVLVDYQEFGRMSTQYRNDAETFGGRMDSVKKSIDSLSTEIEDMAGAIDGIDVTVRESSSGINDIAQKTSGMAEETHGTASKVSTCREAVSELNAVIHKFRL